MSDTMKSLDDFVPQGKESGSSVALWSDGRLLFALAGTRFECPPGEMFYMGLGGHRLADEDWAACALREVREEIGAEVDLIDSPDTWLVSTDRVDSRIEVSDHPRPLALFEMISSGPDEIRGTYHIAVYEANLRDQSLELSIEEVRAVLALTPDQVIRGPETRPTLRELIDDGALVMTTVTGLDVDTCVFPIGSAQALAHVLRHTKLDI